MTSGLDRRTFDAIIVGGGIVGTAAARALAREGLDVALFERTRLGFGASSRNIGFVFLHGRKGVSLDIARRNRVLLDNFYDEVGGDFEYRRNGGLVLCESQEQLPLLKEFVDARRRDGLNVEFIDRHSLLELAPDVHENVLGASFCSDDAQIGTATVVRALAGSAVRSGATVLEGYDVLEILTASGRVTGISTHVGRFEAPIVVWATGPWHRMATSSGPLELPVKSMRNQLIATTPQLPRLKCVLYGAICLAAYTPLVKDLPSFSPDLFDQRETKAGECMMDAISQRVDGSYVFGGPVDEAGFSWEPDVDGVGRILRRFVRLFPGLATSGFKESWAGRIPYTSDNLPIIDRHPAATGLLVASGLSFGNSSALVAAEGLADLAMERPKSELIAQLGIDRTTLTNDFSYSLG
ncbi:MULTISPECIES: NAD(P)/FAD-dependent oxidoreductase [unclassified Mesorhizobium]|uniref:NAD(P)/FAD-dependent oxidoreductase n=1 Tax=unclassified Mesorhizobium TaxID=325217 RepID=UPI0004B76B60|nr:MULTISPECIES: FAD-dependent oxidoreductase [unclassified Mesorhizobium]